ncbi:MAG: LysR family transcriptional regulator [Desulfohalobiaceae bacterium]|nr:LysR family transcriptional regulator [Desulfohalobiaceae bacterium]
MSRATESNRKKNMGPFTARSKVWIENADREVVLGPGRYRILDAIQRLGSLQAAAKELRMGYKALWARITATERRLGLVLLEKDRTGSRLPPEAEVLMQRYRRMNRLVNTECDEVFDVVIRSALRGDGEEDAI